MIDDWRARLAPNGIGCCVGQLKPCSYHEGWLDAVDLAEDVITELLDRLAQVTAERDETWAVLAWFADAELHESLLWSDDRPPRFDVVCSDVFWWATADCEPVTAADLPSLQMAYDDLERCGEGAYAPELWVARKRGMRPQTPWWDREKFTPEVKALFLAAGPERG